LKLENECDPIDYSSLDADGHIVSPIFHEISNDVFKKLKMILIFYLLTLRDFYAKRILKIILF
jgi:hypothetical protein